MNKIKKIWMTIGTITTITTTFVVVSCTKTIKKESSPKIKNPKTHLEDKNKSKIKTELQRKKSSLFISKNQKINYVALGDSISAGFDGTLDKDYQGKKLSDGKIDGLSFPAFLARALDVNNRVESFENFSMTGSTVDIWNDLLFTIPKNDIERYNLDMIKETIFGDGFEKIIEGIKTKLKNSNLVTFTLGGNDFINSAINEIFKTQTINSLLEGKAIDLKVFFNSIGAKLASIVEMVKNKTITFVNNLKKLAPKANINIIQYPLPLLKLEGLITKIINQNTKFKDISYNDFFNNWTNNVFKDLAVQTNINYINAFNYDYWKNNKNELTTLFFDIHPSIQGYKKMALDIYLKITNNFYQKEEFDQLGDFGFSEDYIMDDFETSKYQIEVENYKTTIKSQFGASTSAYIDNKNSFEKDAKKFKTENNYIKHIKMILEKYSNTINIIFLRLAQLDFYKKIDYKGELLRHLNTYVSPDVINIIKIPNRFTYFYSSILQGEFLNNLLSIFEDKISQKIKDNPNKELEWSDITESFFAALKAKETTEALINSLFTGPFEKFSSSFFLILLDIFSNNPNNEIKEIGKLLGF